ncbi:SDR family oxidoreductase [Microcella humidisoli]|uniref:SDR family oxidoreductase n=1 Tax=Microcella humidisoli TaxID=2963406 RepID=A0ABY5FUC9_9MICO|nr:SDR family oxidoreductase [Microcella humidisoli]UTT61917.1 SDR family oxidoreductase [Microcella humidisoli]
MTTLITGATGHLGRLAIEALLDRGVDPATIVGSGRSVEKAADLAARGVRIVAADYTDASSLDAAFAGVDRLVLVSSSEVGQRATQHQAVIDAAVRAGVQHLVYTSVLDAEDTALILAPEHKATEQAIRASGIPFTFLRNGWYTENYAATITQAAATGTVLTSAGEGRVSSALRAEYAEAIAAVLTSEGHDGRVYELSGDTAWSFAELAGAIAEVAGTAVELFSVSAEDHAAALSAAGLNAATTGFLVALDGDIRAGLLDATSGDLARLIGRPTMTLVDAVRAIHTA